MSNAVTFADFTAIAVLMVIALWLFRSEPPRALLRAMRRRGDVDLNVEEM